MNPAPKGRGRVRAPVVSITVKPAVTLFEVYIGDRRICTSRTPLLAAARVLQKEGLPDETVLEMRHAGTDVVALRATIGTAAGLTVREDDGPRFVKFDPRALVNSSLARRGVVQDGQIASPGASLAKTGNARLAPLPGANTGS